MQINKHCKLQLRVATMIVVVAMFFVAMIPNISAKAASYNGSGTKADPYLVQTAEQLQGIRENLSAHYKLANTIDLSGIDFKPIGRIDQPFTGSFVCELNTDKTPKYIIKNLKIQVKESPYVSEGKSKWEAGMFGATDGATFTGIYVLDAQISNDNYGDNRGSIQYNNYKPGMDEQDTGILIGRATSSSITNCATTGKINARSNGCGGVVGRAISSKFNYCYSTADVITEGLWNTGGFVGTAKESIFVNCFATGDAVCGHHVQSHPFCGQTTNKSVDEQNNTFKGCIATGKAGENPPTDSTVRLMPDGITWNKGGGMPTINGIGIVTDASKYQPETVQTSQGNSPTQNGTTQTSTMNAQEETVLSDEVKSHIEALPDPTEEGAISVKHKDAIKEAWKAYESMSTVQKEEFDLELVAKLTDCRMKVSILMVGEWMTDVEELPNKEELTTDHVDKILELWDDYLFMDDSLKAELNKDVIEKLEDAYDYAMDIKQNGATIVNITEVFSEKQKLIVYMCIGVLVGGVIFNVVAFIILFKKFGRSKEKAKIKEQ